MKRILQLKRAFPIKADFRLCFLCSFFFIWGCGKPATSPISEPVEVSAPEDGNSTKTTSITDSAPSIKVTGLPSDFRLNGRIEWNHSLFKTLDGITLPPRLRVLLVLNESEEREIVAYGNLRLGSSKTDSGRLKLAQGYPSERITSGLIPLDHFLLWKNQSGNETVVPIDFLYPPKESKTLTELKGKLSLMTAGVSSVETISDLQSFISHDSSEAKLPPDGVEVHLLPPEYKGASSSIAVTFTSDVIISDAHILDDEGNRLRETWAELSQLPDGRSRIVVVSESEPMTEKWQLQFKRHSELDQSEIDFEIRNLPIPKLELEVSEEQKRLVRWTPSSVKSSVPTDHHVEAKVNWGRIVTFEQGDMKVSSPLEISVDITGPKAAKTIGLGQLQIDSAVAAGEQLFPIKEEGDSFSGLREGIFAYEPSPYALHDGAQAVFLFQPARDEVRKIDEFSGSLTLLTAMSQKNFVVENIMQYMGKAIEHPLLKKHNITLIPEMFGNGLNVPVKADNVLVVQEMAAVDKSGSTSRSVYSGRQQFNGRTVFSFTAKGKLPEVIPVRITINEGLEEMTVPFAFKNLDVPPKPKDMNVPRQKIKSSSR